MVIDENAPSKNEVSLTASREQLDRQLIEQFYEDSLERYGSSSEQARMFSVLLAEFDS
jgi:hypothetical protein